MENAKTIILNNKLDKDFKAILNLRAGDGSIKFFNGVLQNKNFALGVKQGNDVLKMPLIVQNNASSFYFPHEVDLKKDVVCAVVDVTNAFCPELVLSGSLNTVTENTKIESAFITKKPEDTSKLYIEDSDEEIDSLVEKNIQEDMNSTYYDTCASCKYRKAFYEAGKSCSAACSCNTLSDSGAIKEDSSSSAEILSEQNEDINQVQSVDNEEVVGDGEQDFYLQVKSQIDALFERYESEETLQTILPNSKWVKVRYDNGEEYYVLGLVFDKSGKKVDFICYGVPSTDPNNPPDDIKEYAQWLPLDLNNNSSGGYWIVYQNGSNGETVVVNFV